MEKWGAASICDKRKGALSAYSPKEVGTASLQVLRQVVMPRGRFADLALPLRLKTIERQSRDIGLFHGTQIEVADYPVGLRSAIGLLKGNPRTHLRRIETRECRGMRTGIGNLQARRGVFRCRSHGRVGIVL